MDLKDLMEKVVKTLSKGRKTIPKICQTADINEFDAITAIFELEMQKKAGQTGWKSLYDGKEQRPLFLAVYGLTPTFRHELAITGKL